MLSAWNVEIYSFDTWTLEEPGLCYAFIEAHIYKDYACCNEAVQVEFVLEMSFLDLLLAEAIAAGLAREAARERPPENFFVLPREPRAWRMFQTASQKEMMVVAIEITNNMAPNCRAVQPLFIELARKFSSVPFLRVEIGLGRTYDTLIAQDIVSFAVYFTALISALI